ncbi:MAG: cation diffusion facilitator family transporter [Hyphomicrobiaceae bacterium]
MSDCPDHAKAPPAEDQKSGLGPAPASGDGHRHHRGHDHVQSHRHDHTSGASETRIAVAAALTGAFMVAEIVGGLVAGSLALLADAGHMLTDFGALALAWFAFRLARRPASWQRSYGFDRFSVLVAFGNGLALFAIAGWIVVEAIGRLQTPAPVLGGIMLWVALAGLAVNIAAFLVLQGADAGNLNVRAAALHVTGDLLGSVAAIVAAGVILTTGFTPIDPLLSVLVAVIILRSAWQIVVESGHILLEATPVGVDTREIGRSIREAVPGVADVHHVHAWSITEKRRMITMHVRTAPTDAPEGVTRSIKQHVSQRYGIHHATIEIEFADCADARPGKQHGRDR